jgi:hypothetical protein
MASIAKRKKQKYVKQRPADMQTETQKSQNQKNNENGPMPRQPPVAAWEL